MCFFVVVKNKLETTLALEQQYKKKEASINN